MVPYAVRFAPELAATLAQLKASAETSKSKRQLYDCLRRCATQLLPVHAGHPSHVLSGSLRGVVFRVKQGRLRIFYTMSVPGQQVILLCIGNRKEGDKHDAYAVLDRRIRAGDFDDQFAECGHERPKV